MSQATTVNENAETLAPGVVEVTDASGETRRFEGENLLVACAGHYSGMKPIKLGAPGDGSMLSGEPAYLVRLEHVSLTLSIDEFLHLALNALNPDQVAQLRERCGTFSLIDAAYYDPDTGEALQPKVRVMT